MRPKDTEDEEICRIFSRKLRSYMADTGMNQKELAKRVGASTSQVSLWCLGRNVPRTNYLSTLTEIFDCKLSDLLTDKSKDPPPEDDGPLPPGYSDLNDTNKAIVDSLIAQLAKSQSETEQAVGRAQKDLSTKR